MAASFDDVEHERLLALLAASSFVTDYFNLCKIYAEAWDVGMPRLDMARTLDIFRQSGVEVELNKKFKVFAFDSEQIAGWTWTASLVVQRYDSLELLLQGIDQTGDRGVGSNWISLATDAGRLMTPPFEELPGMPVRPDYNGDMRTMERLVPDLIELFRSVKGTIRQGW